MKAGAGQVRNMMYLNLFSISCDFELAVFCNKMHNIMFAVLQCTFKAFVFVRLAGNSGYPDFTNPEMQAWWASMFAYDQYEVKSYTFLKRQHLNG